MSISKPIEPNKRIEIIDILRGFALLGIIFMNMSFFSGYMFMPFEELKQISNFGLDNKLYNLLEITVTGKFYTIFSILFAVGFYIQINKNRDRTVDFFKNVSEKIVHFIYHWDSTYFILVWRYITYIFYLWFYSYFIS